ncbi:MAG: methyl-accepting chemotaxis protein [Magnetococcales bacterium]|nr:methyl-accepting chemotaxis protein [Magnetococcales bacterium]
MQLTHMKIGSRLGVAFGLLVVFMVLQGWWGITQLERVADLVDRMYLHPLTVSNAVRDIQVNIMAMHRSMKDAALAKNEAQVDQALAEMAGHEKMVLDRFQLVYQRFLGGKKSVDQAYEAFLGWRVIRERMVVLIRAGNQSEAASVTREEGAAYVRVMEEKIQVLVDFASNKAGEFLKMAQKTSQESFVRAGGLSAVSILLALAIGVFITRSITNPLVRLTLFANQLARYDLSPVQERDVGNDEVGELFQAFLAMLETFRTQTQEIRETTSRLAIAINQISSTAAELATSSAETSSTITQVTATVEEVRHTAFLAEEKSGRMYQEAQKVSRVAQEGRRASADATEGIRTINEEMRFIAESIVRLSEQTQNIGEIIGAVNDLADQSNLLSVNASIEAAKAGDVGKGFAVVAQEVKSLAEQSREATGQIKGILNDIQKATSASVMAIERGGKAVEKGVTLAARAGEIIISMAATAAESSEAAAQISASSKQQLTGMEQLVSAINAIQQATSQNAEGARQLEGATRDLNAMSSALGAMIAKFKGTH